MLSVHVNVAIGFLGLPVYINVAIVCMSVFLDKVHASVSSLPSRHRRVRDGVPMQSVLREPPGRVPVQVCSRLRSGKGPVLLQVCGKWELNVAAWHFSILKKLCDHCSFFHCVTAVVSLKILSQLFASEFGQEVHLWQGLVDLEQELGLCTVTAL